MPEGRLPITGADLRVARSDLVVTGEGVDASVSAMVLDEARDWLYVCGGFSRAGGASASGLALWEASRCAPPASSYLHLP